MEVSRRQFLEVLATAIAGCSTEQRPQSVQIAPTSAVGAATAASDSVGPTTLVTGRSATTSTTSRQSIEVIERAGWGAASPGQGMVEQVITRLTIHHTAVELTDNRLAPERLRGHQEFHQTDRGWPDLAYHFAIDLMGNVYEGRPLRFRGDTATTYDPTGHLLVVLEGDFDQQPLGADQQSSAADLLAWAAVRHDVDPTKIGCHRDYADTSCPGEAAYTLIASGDFSRAVQRVIDGGVPELVYLLGEAARQRVAGIQAALR